MQNPWLSYADECQSHISRSLDLPLKFVSAPYLHTGQCKRTGGCYNELVVAFFSTGRGVKGKKSIPVDFIIYILKVCWFLLAGTANTGCVVSLMRI